MPGSDARRYVAAIFQGLASGLDGETPFTELGDRHATSRGLNERLRQALAAAGLHDMVRQALDHLLARILQ